MPLPKLEVPTYEIELPLSKKKIKYRPFVVKEQKSLLMAMESGDADSIQNIVRDILEVCTLTKGINFDEMPIIDVEYFFINLRAKSVGEIVESKYRCNNMVEDKMCNNIMETRIDLTEIKVENDTEIDPKIQLTDSLILKMKYPEFGLIKSSIEMDNITEVTFNMIANSIEYIYDGEQFYYAKEQTQEELLQFVEQLNQQQFSKIENFLEHLPKLKKDVKLKCSKCNYEHEMNVEGLESFFGF